MGISDGVGGGGDGGRTESEQVRDELELFQDREIDGGGDFGHGNMRQKDEGG